MMLSFSDNENEWLTINISVVVEGEIVLEVNHHIPSDPELLAVRVLSVQ